MKSFDLKVPLYYQKICIIQTDDFKRIEKEFDLTSTEGYNAFTFKKNNIIFAVFLESETTPSIVSHECVHICDYVFDSCFIKPDLENNEPYAYLMGWIVGEIHKLLTIDTEKP